MESREDQPQPGRRRRLVLGLASLMLGVLVWFPCERFLFEKNVAEFRVSAGLSSQARLMANRQLRLWTDKNLRRREIEKMRAGSAEWDFMGRTFLAWSMAEMTLRDPARRAGYFEALDNIIDETLRQENEKGMYHFLLSYAMDGNFLVQPKRSQFIDGETALMLGLRRLAEEKEAYRRPLAELVDVMVRRMEMSPVLSAESYPNECWTFCNTIALAAIRIADFLDGTDHSELLRRWVEIAKKKLIDPKSGLLIGAYTLDGDQLQGPEGSSIWMSIHALRLVDDEFALEQYRLARRELGRSFLGFSYAREWPPSFFGRRDIDSGPVVPIFEAGPASSGLALVAAASFGDLEYYASLTTTLEFLGFPLRRGDELNYCVGNQLGNAVVLYSTVLGPLWERVAGRAAR